jgi:type IV secretory pathway component VirB8
MNDLEPIARPVPPEEIEEWERLGPSLFAEHRNNTIRLNRVSLYLNLGQTVTIVMLGIAIAVLATIHEVLPLFIAYNGDVVQTAPDLSLLPPTPKDNVVKSVLWTVAENWEEYTFHGAKKRFDLVSALTTGKAQAKYQHWFQHDTDHSPQYTVGDRGEINVSEIAGSAVLDDKIAACRTADWCEAHLSLWHTVQMYGQAPAKSKHYTVRFSYIFVDGLSAGELASINPASIKVIDYHTECDDCGSLQ